MAIEKITTPDGQIPSAARPVEDVDYTVVGGALQTGDIVRAGGSDFYRYTAPSDPPDPQPVVFYGADWQEYAYGVLGAIALPSGTAAERMLAGIARYGAILKAGRASSADATIAAFDQYDRQSNFRKDKVQVFLGLLNSDGGIVTTEEFEAIILDWPSS